MDKETDCAFTPHRCKEEKRAGAIMIKASVRELEGTLKFPFFNNVLNPHCSQCQSGSNHLRYYFNADPDSGFAIRVKTKILTFLFWWFRPLVHTSFKHLKRDFKNVFTC